MSVLRIVTELTVVLLLIVLLSFAVLGDLLSAISVQTPLLLSGLLFGALVSYLGVRALKSRVVSSAGVVFVLLLLLLRVSVLNPVKPFRAFFADLRPGMSSQAVLASLHRHFPPQGRFPVPAVHRQSANMTTFVLDLSEADYNSEIIAVSFDHDALTWLEYMPD